MQITFGMNLDGAAWSEKPASLGEMTCGPLQLLAWLEDEFGLCGADVSQPERIGAYRAKMELADCAWCRASFKIDPWSCAKQLLALRDELVLSGWDFSDGGPERLAALSKIEHTGEPVPPGPGDRLRKLLKAARQLPVRFTTVDEWEYYPQIWKQIISAFFSRTERPSVSPEQRPAIRLVTAPDKSVLAQDLARYLAATQTKQRIALICSTDTTLLDGVLARFNIAAIGSGEESPFRESLQFLPLWLENMWQPFDAQKLLELLLLGGRSVQREGKTFHNALFPHALTAKLADALQRAPGQGGEAWNKAFQEAEAAYAKYMTPDQAAAKIREQRAILEWQRYPEEDGIPADVLMKRLDLLQGLLAPKVNAFPELHFPLAHLRTLKELLKRETQWSRFLLTRVMESIVSSGTPPADRVRQAGDVTVFTHPGQILHDFDTVLWWDFSAPVQHAGYYWSASEKTFLQKTGASLERNLAILREHAAWRNAYNRAKVNFIGFLPQFADGERVSHHPLIDELEFECKQKFLPGISSAELLKNGTWRLADGSRQVGQAARIPETEFKEAEEIGANEIRPRSMSATQMNNFLSCPLRWFLENYAGLQEPPASKIPTAADTMVGTLAHKVIEEMLTPPKMWAPAEAKVEAGRRFDALVPQMGAELLAPGREIDRDRVKKTLMDAVETLFAEIAKRKLTVTGSEYKPEPMDFHGVPFGGSIDILLKDLNGRPYVIDLKWSGSDHYFRLAQESKSVQLASYAKLLDHEKADVPCAYYLFPRREFKASPQDNRAVWEAVDATYQARLADLQSGCLRRGIPPETYPEGSEERADKCAEQHLALDVTPCGFCRWQMLCGKPVPETSAEED